MLRKVTMEDLQKVFEIEQEQFLPAEAASYEAIQHRIKTFIDTFYVWEETGRVIGFINGARSHKSKIDDEMFLPTCLNEPSGDNCLIFSVAIAKDYVGDGYGKTMMKAFILACKKVGIKHLVLTCKKHYISFYTQFGYKNLGISTSEHGGAIWYDMALDI